MHTTPSDSCPACGWSVPARGTACVRCGLPVDGPITAELRHIGAALAAVDAERHRLLSRRAHLLAHALPVRPVPIPPTPARPTAVPGPGGTRETGTVEARDVLLWLGGTLLAVAAVAFTVISWGHLGIAGRSAVLAVLTLTATGVPALLLRRALGATAEVVACLGLVLLLLDSYAVRRTLLPGPGTTVYEAGTAAVTAVVWAAYAVALRPRAERRGLRLPPHLALVLAQLPLPLWSFTAHSGDATAAALLATALLDALVLLAGDRAAMSRLLPTAVVAGAVTGLLGLLVAAELSLRAVGPGAALRAAALLLGAAACALAVAYRLPAPPEPAGEAASKSSEDALPKTTGTTAPKTAGTANATVPKSSGIEGDARSSGSAEDAVPGSTGGRGAGPAVSWAFVLGVAAGVAAVVGTGGVVRVFTVGEWAVPGYAACAALLLAATAALRRAGARHRVVAGTAAGLAAASALATLWALVPLTVALLGPLGWAGSVWTGVPAGARAATVPGVTWSGPAAAVLTAAVVAVTLAAAGWWQRAWAARAFGGAVGLGVLVVAGLPAAFDLPYPVAVWTRTALAVLLLAGAVLRPRRAEVARAALVGAIGVAVTAVGWALAEPAATVAVLALLTLAFAVAAVKLAGAAVPGGDAWRRAVAESSAVAGSVAVAAAAGLAWAAAAAAGWPAHDAAFGVLAVAALAQGAAYLLPAPPVEYAGGGTALLAVALAFGDTGVLAAVLALAGVLAAAVALRADRRPAAGYLAVALLTLACWVRLGAWNVTAPEAYTLPVTLAALTVGGLRRRRDAAVSSWEVYGPGLAVTLLPSLAAAWGDAHGVRPLLLGAAALAVTLLGARRRLQAPLLLGGAVLALDALHELAPYVVQVVGALPRWLPLALAGALLLAVGTTYDKRLRDARRLRDALRRLG
ncbi:SCO7613 C-terminal domain-containing membrane protein [Streptantibioticus silvisoli]|uniref:Integral membrane protein n=1 Tax=Streptantibioticus silvisoli TaxID=2705255 RepID=A0ABT6VWN9_9ACTN|nr:hypothetical protein [Streptantibioticus silvisoli]MDI5961686.1 hypothetical protein [Streptantibioticus silvisoli]